MEASHLEAIYSANTRPAEQAADRFDARQKKSTEVFDSEEKKRTSSAEREEAKRQRAAEKTAKAMADAMRRASNQRDAAIQSLASDLPGGRFLSRFGQVKKDLDAIRAAEAVTGQSTSSLSAVVESLGGTWVVAGAGIAVGTAAILAGGAAALSVVKNYADYAAQIQEIGQESGLTAPTISTVGAYARLAGADVKSAASALEIYLKNASEAAHGNPALAKSFQRFGIDAKAVLRDTDQGARDLLDHLAAIKNPAERLDAAFKLAGKGGKVLASIAEEMGGSFAQAQRQAEEWGVVLSEEDVQAADRFGDAWDILKMKIEGGTYRLAREVLPELKKAIDDIGSALNLNSSSVEHWGQGFAYMIARARGSAEGFAEWWRGQDWSPRKLGNLVHDAADRAGNEYIQDYLLNPFKSSQAAADAQLARMKGGAGIGDVQGKGGASAAKRAAQLALESARIDLREAESVFRDANAIARRGYEQNLRDFDSYLKDKQAAEEDRYAAEKKVFERERAAIGKLPAKERDVKLEDISQRERDALRKHNDEMAGLTVEGQKHAYDVKRDAAERELQFQQETNRLLNLDLEEQIGQGTTTAVEAYRKRTEALGEEALKQGEVLQLALVNALGGSDSEAAKKLSDTINETIANAINGASVGELAEQFKVIMSGAANPEAVREALGQIQLFFIRRRQILKEGNKDARDSAAEDLQTRQAYANRLAEINDAILDSQIEVSQLAADAISSHAFSRNVGIEANRALDIARETARHAREIRELEQRKAQFDLLADRKKSAELIEATNRQIEQVESEHNARLADIDRQAAEERREQFREIVSDFADIYGDFLDHLGGDWSDTWRDMLNTARRILIQIAQELFKISFTHEPSSVGGLVGAISNAIGGRLVNSGLPSGSSFVNSGGASPYLQPAAVNAGGFASGGSFLVPGHGGVDSTPVFLRATPGERVTVEKPGRAGGADLEQLVSRMERAIAQIPIPLFAVGDDTAQRMHENAVSSARGRRVIRKSINYTRKANR